MQSKKTNKFKAKAQMPELITWKVKSDKSRYKWYQRVKFTTVGPKGYLFS